MSAAAAANKAGLLSKLKDALISNAVRLAFAGFFLFVVLWGDARWVKIEAYTQDAMHHTQVHEKVNTQMEDMRPRVQHLEGWRDEVRTQTKDTHEAMARLNDQVYELKTQQAVANALLIENSKSLDRIFRVLNERAVSTSNSVAGHANE